MSATYKKTPAGKYEVTLTVEARKVQADANGVESRMPLDDYIDIGVVMGSKKDEKPLYMKREKFDEARRSFTIVVDGEPSRAGIDPYNKLIDRIADDNMVEVSKQ